MERVDSFRRWLGITFGALGAALGGPIASSLAPDKKGMALLILGICVAVSLLVRSGLYRYLIAHMAVRRYILGAAWIEGVWVVDIYDKDGNLKRTAVSELAYDGADLAVNAVSYLPRSGSGDKGPGHSFTKFARIADPLGHFLILALGSTFAVFQAGART